MYPNKRLIAFSKVAILSMVLFKRNVIFTSYNLNERSSRSQMFFKIGALNNFAKHLVLESLSNKKKGLQHRCFPEKFAKFLRTLFLTEHLRWLLLEGNKYGLSHINATFHFNGFQYHIFLVDSVE